MPLVPARMCDWTSFGEDDLESSATEHQGTQIGAAAAIFKRRPRKTQRLILVAAYHCRSSFSPGEDSVRLPRFTVFRCSSSAQPLLTRSCSRREERQHAHMADFRVPLESQLHGCDTIPNIRWYRSMRPLNPTAAVVTRVDRLSPQSVCHEAS